MSTLKANNLQTVSGSTSVPVDTVISGTVKGWVYFNANAGSPLIGASFNVSSITYVSTGTFIVNWTNALSNANYAVFSSANNGSVGVCLGVAASSGTAAPTLKTTSQIQVTARVSDTGTLQNSSHLCVAAIL